jgi:sugar phosphate isomerase/epimerase
MNSIRIPPLSRREAMTRAGVLVGAAVVGGVSPATPATTAAEPPGGKSPFILCFNTATIRGQKLGLVKELEVAAQAGYQAIEPWTESIEAHAKSGGSLKDVQKRAADLGMTVESAIGFPEWLVDDDARRAKGLERARYEMDLVAQIGGKRLAAPPAGATGPAGLDFARAVERYRALLEAGDQIGVVPNLELWGFSQNLHRLGECVAVAMETGHPKAAVLADIFHLHKGGSDFRGIRLLGPDVVQVLHMNDYPADPPRDKINDSFRMYPGDGTAPIVETLRLLRATGGSKVLSLELFSRKYWEQDPLEVARTGLARMKAVVEKALA